MYFFICAIYLSTYVITIPFYVIITGLSHYYWINTGLFICFLLHFRKLLCFFVYLEKVHLTVLVLAMLNDNRINNEGILLSSSTFPHMD